jgi:predicted DNA-binding transcriptional regulator YafY
MDDEVNVRNDDVRDVFDVPDDEAKRRRTWIIQQLSGGIRLKNQDVADQFKRSKKTAQRDFDALRAQGEVEFLGDPKTGYYRLCAKGGG